MAAREEPAVQECKSRQCAAARLNKTFEMACKYVNGQYIFHQPCGLWNAPCVDGCGYIHLSSSMPGSSKKCCTDSCLSLASDNFDKELMMDHDLGKLPQFLRQVIILSPEFSKKSSTYNNLVTMAATMVCNYNQTHGFSRCGQGQKSIFMNGHVHHYMRISSSTLQNCGTSYFIFDDIASLAGSVDTQNIDPVVLSNICKGPSNENSYCVDLRFLGVEARQCAEGINVVPRMVDQVQHVDVCSVVNKRQTGAMTLQVKHILTVCQTSIWILRRWRDYAFHCCSPMESPAILI